MESKKGIALPDDFAELLQGQPQLLTVFERMRPSCQRGYADWIDGAADETARTHRIERVMGKISKWGERHQLIGEAD